MTTIQQKRLTFNRQWKAWRKSCEIRKAHRGAAPVKRWYDECRTLMEVARRELVMELRRVRG